jgi:regulator of protease activity HflC (stomatin/prohibitin superfamily)
MHGNRTIVIVEQGYIGYATDNGQPVLLPPGIHVWTSESMEFERSVALRDHLIAMGPYTLITCDEGYAAVTQNNGKQVVLDGGHTHLLDHMNWKFEKFMTLKIQTDDLERIQATSADNINMMVTSTVNWRIVDVVTAATMAAETMATSGKTGDVSADITKLRKDVLKQALASLAGFIGGVNYSESFHMSAAEQSKKRDPRQSGLLDEPEAERGAGKGFTDNPLYDPQKMMSSVEHANRVTNTYGIEVMSINIISAAPCDAALTKSLASGAVASATALQAETQARGQANAMRIAAQAEAQKFVIEAQGKADSKTIQANALGQSRVITAESDKAAEVLRGEGEAERTRLHADATADGLKAVAHVVGKPGGEAAMVQRLAEQYVTELPEMAKASKMMIVPDKPTDVSGVVATALSMTSIISSK